GAGSAGLRPWRRTRAEPLDLPTRVERYCPGRAASVALLCGAGEPVVLVPCWHALANDGTFAHRSGLFPLHGTPDGPLAAPRRKRRAALWSRRTGRARSVLAGLGKRRNVRLSRRFLATRRITRRPLGSPRPQPGDRRFTSAAGHARLCGSGRGAGRRARWLG